MSPAVRFLRLPRAMQKPLFAATAAAALLALRSQRNRRRAERLAAASLETLLNAVDANDPVTGAHVRRVAAYALIVARALGLPQRAQHDVERVALFHDIGKIHEALFDIVHDDDSLTASERALIALHPAGGARVLAPLGVFYPRLAEGVAAHHERWDGTGYPRGLRGVRIPLAARIVAITDSFDAITQRRRYRGARPVEVARRAIAEGQGTQFDPQLAELFLSPGISAAVEQVLHAPAPPPPTLGDRRRRPTGRMDAPDVTFRWRAGAPAPPAPGHLPRTAPG